MRQTPLGTSSSADLQRQKSWEKLEADIDVCTACPLHKNRLTSVENRYVRGSPMTARIVFVGEAPGAMEQHLGVPFIGTSGKLLQEWIDFMGLSKEDYLITNVVKHRPLMHKRNRPPTVEEARACIPWLREQIRFVRPFFLVSLGRVADRWLTEMGKKHYHIPHPAWFLRSGKPWFDEVEALMEAYKEARVVYDKSWFR